LYISTQAEKHLAKKQEILSENVAAIQIFSPASGKIDFQHSKKIIPHPAKISCEFRISKKLVAGNHFRY
jgi:hypothetical protein